MSALAGVGMPSLVVMMGAPASGKTTLATAVWPGLVVNVDRYRRDYSPDGTRRAFVRAYTLTRSMLDYGSGVVFDSTACTERVRGSLLGFAADAGVPAHLVVLRVPVDVCESRNLARPRVTPPGVLRSIHRQVEDALDADVASEGWSSVVVLDAVAASDVVEAGSLVA